MSSWEDCLSGMAVESGSMLVGMSSKSLEEETHTGQHLKRALCLRATRQLRLSGLQLTGLEQQPGSQQL